MREPLLNDKGVTGLLLLTALLNATLSFLVTARDCPGIRAWICVAGWWPRGPC